MTEPTSFLNAIHVSNLILTFRSSLSNCLLMGLGITIQTQTPKGKILHARKTTWEAEAESRSSGTT